MDSDQEFDNKILHIHLEIYDTFRRSLRLIDITFYEPELNQTANYNLFTQCSNELLRFDDVNDRNQFIQKNITKGSDICNAIDFLSSNDFTQIIKSKMEQFAQYPDKIESIINDYAKQGTNSLPNGFKKKQSLLLNQIRNMCNKDIVEPVEIKRQVTTILNLYTPHIVLSPDQAEELERTTNLYKAYFNLQRQLVQFQQIKGKYDIIEQLHAEKLRKQQDDLIEKYLLLEQRFNVSINEKADLERQLSNCQETMLRIEEEMKKTREEFLSFNITQELVDLKKQERMRYQPRHYNNRHYSNSDSDGNESNSNSSSSSNSSDEDD